MCISLRIPWEAQLQEDPEVLQLVVRVKEGERVRPPMSSDDRLGFALFCTGTFEMALSKLYAIREECIVHVV